MWCDIYLIRFSFQRGDHSVFYSIPEGRGFSAEDVLEAESSYREHSGISRPLVGFQKLDTKKNLEPRFVRTVIDRPDMRKLLKE